MKWIGLTGGIASGKSTVSAILKKLSYVVVDADEIAREVVEFGSPGLRSVVREFGEDILDSAGELDRRKLGQRVFGRPQELQKLESILHPLVRARVADIKKQLTATGVQLAFYDVPLLFEKKMEADFSAVVVVSTTPELQASRLRSRNQFSDDEIQARIDSQIALQMKIQKAHFVIHNNQGLVELEREVERMLEFVQKLKN